MPLIHSPSQCVSMCQCVCLCVCVGMPLIHSPSQCVVLAPRTHIDTQTHSTHRETRTTCSLFCLSPSLILSLSFALSLSLSLKHTNILSVALFLPDTHTPYVMFVSMIGVSFCSCVRHEHVTVRAVRLYTYMCACVYMHIYQTISEIGIRSFFVQLNVFMCLFIHVCHHTCIFIYM